MFIAAMSTVAKLWKETRCLPTHEWIKQMWYIYTMEYYSAIKKNEILSFAMMWMELEYIMLSEISQQKTHKTQQHTHNTHITLHSQKTHSTHT